MSKKSWTLSIKIIEKLPCEIFPTQDRKTGPFTADEESFFEAGYAMMTENDAPDDFADLAPQSAESTSTNDAWHLRQVRATAVLVAASWSKVRGSLVRTSVTMAALCAASWLKMRGSLARTSVTLAAIGGALWSKVQKTVAGTSVTMAAICAALWSKLRGSLARTSVTLAAIGGALRSKVQRSLAWMSVTMAVIGMLAVANVRKIITGGIGSLARHSETRWRRHRDGEMVLCESHGTVRRGRHNTLLGYPVLIRRL